MAMTEHERSDFHSLTRILDNIVYVIEGSTDMECEWGYEDMVFFEADGARKITVHRDGTVHFIGEYSLLVRAMAKALAPLLDQYFEYNARYFE